MNLPLADNLRAARTRPETFDALTGLRGIAAWWVAMAHFHGLLTLFVPQLSSLGWLFSQGFRAVPLFFLLSGFVITHNYWDKFQSFSFPVYRDYIWSRFARIYPAYLVALLVMVSMVATSAAFHLPYNRTAYPLATLPLELLMIHKWGSIESNGWNYPSWSVSSEWFAYICAFPCAIWLGRRIRQPALVFGMVVLLLAAEGWRTIQPAHFPSFGYALLMTSLLFLAGSLAWHLRPHIPEKCHLPMDSIAGLASILLLVFQSNLSPALFEMLMLVSFTCLIVGLSQRQGLLVKFLSLSFMVWMGEISYSLYITHGVVHRALKPLVDRLMVLEQSVGLRILLVILHLGAVLGAAAALYYMVEKPGRAWLRKIYFQRAGESV